MMHYCSRYNRITSIYFLDSPPLRKARAQQSATPSFTAQHHNHTTVASNSVSCPSSCLCISFGQKTPYTSVGKFIVDALSGSSMSLVHPSRHRLGMQSSATMDETNPTPITATLPLVSLPAVCLPRTPPTEKTTFPRVVVVNPTPHPTPPATPTSHPSTVHPQLPSMHLLPPLHSPMLLAVASPEPPPTEPIDQIDQEISPLRNTRTAKPDPPTSSGTKTADSTLKASDRRFFLQQQSPERESPERSADASTDGGKLSVGSDADSGGSRSSQNLETKGSAESERPVTAAKPARKTKEVVRNSHKPVLRRAQTARHHASTLKRQSSVESGKHRPTFNIGSSSSNGSKSNPNCSGSSTKQTVPLPPLKEPSPPKCTPSPLKQPPKQPPGRRVVVDDSASSDYETTDSEDESWLEETSAEENERSKESKEATRLKEAALEAQRQRDMFAKLPKRSYSNLDRTQSGLLTALLNPDPNIFPPNHPYRASHSSENVTQLKRRNGPAGFTPLVTGKSSTAVPQTSQAAANASLPQGPVGGTYQPKGRPQNVEMEDSDSDDENADDKIQVSRSVAQEKLAALAGRRTSDRAPPARPPQPAPPRPSLPTVTSAPIPFGHPYNLPAPAPPSTPRTTRRQMLSTELSESLRRNLLWQRQMNKNDVLPQQQRKSAMILNGGLQPLTTVAGGPSNNNGGGNNKSTSHEGLNKDEDEKTARMKRALARNRSWADDYHYSGW